jgi:MATE family multidrug resistance protein
MLRLAWPLVASMMGVIAIETTDMVMIARLGEDALAAAALGFNLFILFVLFGVGVTSAVTALAAQALGRDDITGVRRTARQGLWLGAALSVPTIAILLLAEPILITLGQKPHLAAMAQGYLDYMAWALLPIFGVLVLRQTMAAFEVVRPALAIILCMVPLNAALNWIFMFGGLGLVTPMGLPGAGLSTLLVDILSLVLIAAYILRARRFRDLDLLHRLWRPDWPRLQALARIGLPTGALLVLENAMFLIAVLFMGWIGTTQLAAAQIAFQVLAILFMVPLGLGQAATIRVASAAGASALDQVRSRGLLVFGLTVAIMGVFGVLLWVFGEWTVGLFIADDEPNRDELLAYGAAFLAIAAFFQIVDGLQVVGGAVLRGLNDTVYAMWLGLIGYMGIGVPAAWVMAFPLGLGGNGVWVGLALGLGIVAIAAVARFRYLCATPARAFRRTGQAMDTATLIPPKVAPELSPKVSAR